MIHEIEEIFHMSGTPLACTRLHELRLKNNCRRGSYGTSQPEVGVAAALTYFEGKSSREKSNMIIELLQTLSMEDQDSQTPECLSTELCSFLHARDKVSEIIPAFSDDIVCCNPLDNMITALTQHPARITNKWRLEFTRWCDWSRILTPGPNSNAGIWYSKLSKQFCETLRFVCSEQTYIFAIAHMGNDPDSTGLVNLSGSSDTSVRRLVRCQTQTFQAGGCALTLHAYSQALRTAYNAEMPTLLPHVKIELDFTDLHMKWGCRRVFFRGKEKLIWAILQTGQIYQIHFNGPKHYTFTGCILPSLTIKSEIDIQLHVYSLVQALQECQVMVLQASERAAHLVKIAKTSQLKEAMQSYSKMPNPLPPTTTHADLLQRIYDGESEFKKFIYISSTMAKNAVTLDKYLHMYTELFEVLGFSS